MPLTSRICTQQTLKLLTLEQTNINFLRAGNANSPGATREKDEQSEQFQEKAEQGLKFRTFWYLLLGGDP